MTVNLFAKRNVYVVFVVPASERGTKVEVNVNLPHGGRCAHHSCLIIVSADCEAGRAVRGQMFTVLRLETGQGRTFAASAPLATFVILYRVNGFVMSTAWLSSSSTCHNCAYQRLCSGITFTLSVLTESYIVFQFFVIICSLPLHLEGFISYCWIVSNFFLCVLSWESKQICKIVLLAKFWVIKYERLDEGMIF